MYKLISECVCSKCSSFWKATYACMYMSVLIYTYARMCSIISYSINVPCLCPHPSSDLFNQICYLCLFSYQYGNVSVAVCYVIVSVLLFMFVCAAASWLVGAHVYAPCVIPGNTHELVVFSLQACSNDTLKYIAVLGECCPSSHDSSMNLLVFFSGDVYLSRVDVACNVCYLNYVDIYRRVLSIITFAFDLFIFIP